MELEEQRKQDATRWAESDWKEGWLKFTMANGKQQTYSGTFVHAKASLLLPGEACYWWAEGRGAEAASRLLDGEGARHDPASVGMMMIRDS
jgi:hypothetical protein